ncbi:MULTISPECIES: hypothetical protein [unclassified Pseudomonas]|uniref:hypothetical protein n=1 Tax=unclassified Pseudomonas TaxID=196821 RepID=UPI000A1E9644|nr:MULTISPECIES: hypothetical protein [unclassified Pseudomonas]
MFEWDGFLWIVLLGLLCGYLSGGALAGTLWYRRCADLEKKALAAYRELHEADCALQAALDELDKLEGQVEQMAQLLDGERA